MKKIVELTATENDELLNVIEQSAKDNGFEIESLGDVLDIVKVVADALNYMGIEAHVKWVDDNDYDDEDEWDEEEDDDDDDDDEEDMDSIIYDCDGHRGISAADARLLMQCVAKTLSEKFSGLPEDILTVFIQTETMRIADVYGIEVVDTSGDE